jgi:hypothetical protein
VFQVREENRGALALSILSELLQSREIAHVEAGGAHNQL